MTDGRPPRNRPEGRDSRDPRSSRPPRGVDPIADRLSSLRWSTAIVLAGFLLNAGIVVLAVSAISGSVAVALIAVAALAVFVLCAALFTETFLLNVTDARPLLPEDFPWLRPMVAELATVVGMDEPEIYISPYEDYQAMTTGLGKRTKVVFFTALLRDFSRDEVRAVAAHELAHSANRDVALLVWTHAVSLWVAFISTLALIASHAIFGFGRAAGSTEGGDWTWALAGWIIAFFAFVFGALLWVTTQIWSLISLLTRQAVSRQREYLADATAVAITGDPEALSRALAKIAERPRLSRGAAVGGSFCIVSPFSAGGWWDELTSTHPAPGRRIEEIQKLPKASLRPPSGDRDGAGSASVALPVGSMALLLLLAVVTPLCMSSGGEGSTEPNRQRSLYVPPTPTVTEAITPSPTPSPAPSATPSPPPPASPTPAGVAIRYGDSVVGEISSPEELDDWTFSGEAGDLVTIRMLQEGSASLPPWLRLADPGGTELRTECQNAGPPEARIQNFELPFAGVYTITAAGCYGDSTGGYTLTLSLKPPPGEIAYGQTVTGEIVVTSDYDEWQFTGQAGDMITIRMLQAGGASLPPWLALIDPGGVDLRQECQNVATPTEARIQNYRLEFDGTFRIRASGCYGDSLGGYQLSLARKPPPGQLTYGQQVTGEIAVTSDYDEWQFSGRAGDTITISMLQAGGASLPPWVALIDPSGAEIRVECQNVAPPPEARIENFQLAFSGKYTIRTSGCYGDSLGGYTLSLSIVSP